MKLYGHPLSSCTRKVLITLAEKESAADLTTVDLFTGEHKQPAHTSKHPFGVIPVLDDDGFLLYESRAIIRYLDARLPGRLLTPASAKDRARMDQWLSVDQSYVGPHTRTLAVERILKKHNGQEADARTVADAELALVRAFTTIDRALTSSAYLAGDAFSLADISLIPYVASLSMLGAERITDGLDRLQAWSARVCARPSWRVALAPSAAGANRA